MSGAGIAAPCASIARLARPGFSRNAVQFRVTPMASPAPWQLSLRWGRRMRERSGISSWAMSTHSSCSSIDAGRRRYEPPPEYKTVVVAAHRGACRAMTHKPNCPGRCACTDWSAQPEPPPPQQVRVTSSRNCRHRCTGQVPALSTCAGITEELAASIKAQGIVQPIVVRPVDGAAPGESQRYEIIAGERRWRAAQIAGLAAVPAVIRRVPDEAAIAMALIENIQRENLNPLEEARALERLISEFGITHQQAADAVGRSRAAVSTCCACWSCPTRSPRSSNTARWRWATRAPC